MYENTTETILKMVGLAVDLENKYEHNKTVLSELDKEIDDLLHIIEDLRLTMYESYLFCKYLRQLRQDRRKVKEYIVEYKIWKDNKKHFANAPQNIIGTFSKALTNKKRNKPNHESFVIKKQQMLLKIKEETNETT